MKILIYTIILAIILSVLIGCKTKTVYVPVESIKTEYRDRLERDSIRLYDSIFIDRWKTGDTIYVTKEKYKSLYRDKYMHDTIRVGVMIQVPYPVEVLKEVNRLYNWQIVLMVLGGVAIGYVGFRIYRKIKL